MSSVAPVNLQSASEKFGDLRRLSGTIQQGRRPAQDPRVSILNIIEVHSFCLFSIAELHQIFTSHLADHHAPDEFLALWQRSVGGQTGRGSWAVDYADQ